jgi:hypothetical protein
MRITRMTMAVAAGLCLAGGAQAGDARNQSRDESIALCLQAKEVTLACKEALADHFAALAPADRRERLRAKALQEIIEEGSGPLDRRQAKCALDHDRGKPLGRLTPADLAAVRGCEKKNPDCKARVACWMAVVRRQPDR